MSAAWLVHVSALGLVVLDGCARAARIQMLLPPIQRPSFWRAFVVTAYGEAACAVTPGRIGGDPARFLAFKSSGVSGARAFVAIASEKVIDLVVVGLAVVVLVACVGAQGVGAGDVVRYLTTGLSRGWALAVLALMILGGLGLVWYRQWRPERLGHSLESVWWAVREQSFGVIKLATALSVVSVMARTAVLPVLLMAFHPIADPGVIVAGSFALLYGQRVLPTPAGIGGVELGFVVGFGFLGRQDLVTLLLAWRFYTLFLGAAVGGVLFLRSDSLRQAIVREGR